MRELDFKFFRYECWDLALYVFQEPELSDPVCELPSENTALTQTASILYKFLMVAPEQVNEPKDLSAFIVFQNERAKLLHDFRSQSILKDLMIEIKRLGANAALLSDAVQEELQLRRAIMVQNDALLSEISVLSNEVKILADTFKKKIFDANNVLYSQLLQLFLSKNPEVLKTFEENLAAFCKQRHLFRGYFTHVRGRLTAFLEPSSGYAKLGVTRHLHTQFMQFMHLSSFIEEHTKFQARDFILLRPSASSIFEISGHWQVVQKSSLFGVARTQLEVARTLEIPLETIDLITKFIQNLRNLIELAGENENQLKSAISYIILTANIKNLFSFAMYLEYFLMGYGLLDDEQTGEMLLFTEVVKSVINQLIDIKMKPVARTMKSSSDCKEVAGD
jgi:hypothetical protein